MTNSILDRLSLSTSFSTPTTSTSSLKLFTSPPNTTPLTLATSNFSTDSLDRSLLFSKLNQMNPMDNYTLAFQPLETPVPRKTYSQILTQSCPGWKDKNGNKGGVVDLPAGKEKLLVIYPTYCLPDLDFLKRRPYLLTPGEETPLDKRNERIKDWPSLEFLLPQNYKKMMEDKPLEEREKSDPDEKEKDETVRLRVKDPKKRFSVNLEKRKCKFKRFSLQEIQEITEITKEINDTLSCDLQFHGTQNNINFRSEISNKDFCEEKDSICVEISKAVQEISKATGKNIQSNSAQGKLVIQSLCPSLYSLLSDGLSPHIDTIFGRVPNTVWRVVEASIQCGPTSQSLSELVLRINSEEDTIAEGPIKFNAFIAGLLNLKLVETWLRFLRTKDRLLRTHYTPSALLYSANTKTRGLYEALLTTTSVLSRQSYSLDIFHETKALLKTLSKNLKQSKRSMKRSYSDERPKKGGKELPKSKTSTNIHKSHGRIDKEENKVDKFKKLQLQWEMMASQRKDLSPVGCTGSKIPRPISAHNFSKSKK